MCTVLNHGSYTPENFVMDKFGVGHLAFGLTETRGLPIWNLEGSKIVAMTGTILNSEAEYKKLLNINPKTKYLSNNLEFILHGLMQDRKAVHNFLRALNGVFIIALYDVDDQELVIVNDKFGMKPLFYYYEKSKFLFASEMKALLCDEEIEREINWDGWHDRFAYGYLIGTKTLFKDIWALPNASILTLKNGKVSMEKYWSYNEIAVDRKHSERYFVNEGIKSIRQAIEKWTRHLNECVVFLSGGYDSRCITAYVKESTDINFETFTTKQSRSDGIYAEQVSKCLKINNTYIPLPRDMYERYFIKLVYLLDGACSSHDWIWIMPLIETFEEHRTNLDGIGGDVLLGGLYVSRRNLKNVHDDYDLASILDHELRCFARRPLGKYYHLIGSLRPPNAYDFFDNSLQAKLKPRKSSILKEVKTIRKDDNRVTVFIFKNRTKNLVSPGPSNLISIKMQNYFPFLEMNLVEFALSIPPKMKVPHKKLYCKILKKAFPRVMKIKSTNDLPACAKVLDEIEQRITAYLPAPILEVVQKIYDTPKTLLIKTEIDVKRIDYLITLLNNLTIPAFVKKNALIEYTREYLNRKMDPVFFLEPVVEFCVWYNLFVLGKSPKDLFASIYRHST